MKYLSIIFILVFGLSVFGQTSANKFTNKDVVEMVAAGLPDGVIISKIKASDVVFDTDLPALKALQEAKVSELVISAMIEKSSEKPPEKKRATPTKDALEYGKLEEIKNFTKVYIGTTDVKAREIIARELSKNTSLTIVGTVDEANFLIDYVSANNNTGASIIGNSVTRDNVIIGELYVIMRGKVDEENKQHQRIVWQVRKKQAFGSGVTFSRHPALNAINEFIKAYQKMLSEKNN